jgi:hypothetical protein
MRAALPVPLFLAPLLLLLVAVTTLAAEECASAEVQAHEDWRLQRLPPKCSVQESFFACDDDCHSALQAIMANSSNCTRPYESIYTGSKNDLEFCDNLRSRAANVYMPKVGRGLPSCTKEQLNEWRDKRKLTSFAECGSNATKATGCSDACLRVLETGIANASACADKSGFGLGEASKPGLIKCLRARGDKLADNKVLNTVVNGDGSASTDTNTTSQVSTAPPSTTKSPAPSAASGSTKSLVSVIAIVCAMLLSLAIA